MISLFGGAEIGVLLSGGMDSSILLARLLDQGCFVQPFYIRSDLIWERCELPAVKRFLDAVARPSLRPLVTLALPLADLYEDHWSITGRNAPDADSADEAVFLPGRNALLVVKAAVWCQLHQLRRLALAPLGTSPFADTTPEFFDDLQAALSRSGGRSLQLVRPFVTMNKREVMELGRHYPLELTFSCISPKNDLHCGRCNKCAERQQAFQTAELPDPTQYADAAGEN